MIYLYKKPEAKTIWHNGSLPAYLISECLIQDPVTDFNLASCIHRMMKKIEDTLFLSLFYKYNENKFNYKKEKIPSLTPSYS